uniref:Uncharacterized protein n=1 Tax=Pyxicephalus adspersus TaxID=30357 RepID=A0AAV3AZ56_PYXAD|nr:TPA: hypothetical protein GDO54_001039 [Pyxicephalus adspersus]
MKCIPMTFLDFQTQGSVDFSPKYYSVSPPFYAKPYPCKALTFSINYNSSMKCFVKALALIGDKALSLAPNCFPLLSPCHMYLQCRL